MKKLLGLVCIAKNEGTYLLEWIAHYRSLGVKDLIIYENDSSDNSFEMLRQLQRHGLIDMKRWSKPDGVSPQLSAYADALKQYGNRFEFLAFFDVDEFLAPCGAMDVSTWLTGIGAEVGAIAVNQRIFGSGGHKKREPGLVVERFQRAAARTHAEHRWVKSICRCARLAAPPNPHRAVLTSGRYVLPDGTDAFGRDQQSNMSATIDFSLFQLNHYILKSEEEFLTIKRPRGGAVGTHLSGRQNRCREDGYFYGREAYANECLDDLLAKRKPLIEEEMRRLQAVLV